MSEGLIGVFAQVAMGILCAAIANARGRRPALWFFLGFIFGCVPVIVVAVLPDLSRTTAHKRRADAQRRKRKQQERRALESPGRRGPDEVPDFQSRPPAAEASPIADDVDLVHVADVVPLPPPPPPPPSPFATGSGLPPPIDVNAMSWYYVEGAVQQGPVEFEELHGLWEYGRISSDTLIWTKGLPDWVPVSDHRALHRALGG